MNVNLQLIAELHFSFSLYMFHTGGESFTATFGTLELHSGMTCREFDSFLRGNADELREETCKILFIDAIRIPDRGRDKVTV